MRILRYHSPLMTFLTRLADIILLNVLWIVCSLPLITAGAATTALYSCTLNLDEPTEQPVVRRFFRAFCAGFGKSTALFAVWVVAMALVALDVLFYLYIIEDLDTWFRVLFMIPAFILLLICLAVAVFGGMDGIAPENFFKENNPFKTLYLLNTISIKSARSCSP